MNRPKVLIVDDVEENLILLAFALKAFDVDVVKEIGRASCRERV